jgi:hypothetical protein
MAAHLYMQNSAVLHRLAMEALEVGLGNRQNRTAVMLVVQAVFVDQGRKPMIPPSIMQKVVDEVVTRKD